MTDLDHPAPLPIPRPITGPSRLRRRVLRSLIPFLVVLTLLGVWLYAGHDDPDSFANKAFISAANGACAQAQGTINEQQPPTEDATTEERAASVERVAMILGEMARTLHALPVEHADAPAAGRWLRELDMFVAVGPRYAAAIRSGDERRAEDIGNEGDSPINRFNATARANGIDHCVLG